MDRETEEVGMFAQSLHHETTPLI